MGTYINIGNEAFRSARNSEYVDKSGLIAVVNNTLFTKQRLSCVTRSRRFGKSMAAEMLGAYYDRSCDSRSLFVDLEIASDPSFEQHLNKYPVIFLDMTNFTTRYRNDPAIMRHIEAELMEDIGEAYPQVAQKDGDDLMAWLIRVAAATGDRFIFIIDEWDAILRESRPTGGSFDCYVDWLRRLFKGSNTQQVFAGVYMTGILPIKKYKTQSALNNFIEYSMVEPRRMAKFFGFTKEEVQALADKHGMDYGELEKWYDGYQIGDELSMFNPNSVMQAIDTGRCRSFWAATGAFDSISDYIDMNYDGLKDDIIRMLAGERSDVDPKGFSNDLSQVRSRDDVMTVLIHLGYLTYDWRAGECYIPNLEVSGEMESAVKSKEWEGVSKALQQSKQMLRDTLRCDEEAVARAMDAAHSDSTSILSYNNENSMACVITIAYYYAQGDYVFHREFPSGKGFADIVLLPRKNTPGPAIIVELKYDETAETALDQIRRREYPAKVAPHADNLLIVGLSYSKATKTHSCKIEKLHY